MARLTQRQSIPKLESSHVPLSRLLSALAWQPTWVWRSTTILIKLQQSLGSIGVYPLHRLLISYFQTAQRLLCKLMTKMPNLAFLSLDQWPHTILSLRQVYRFLLTAVWLTALLAILILPTGSRVKRLMPPHTIWQALHSLMELL